MRRGVQETLKKKLKNKNQLVAPLEPKTGPN